MCQALCRLYMLGERLLFDCRFLQGRVRRDLETLLEQTEVSPFTPEIFRELFREILSNSAPGKYEWSWRSEHLRVMVLSHWWSFQPCNTTNYYDYIKCFEQEGAFAAEMMVNMARAIQWAVERWEMHTNSTVDVSANKREHAENDSICQ